MQNNEDLWNDEKINFNVIESVQSVWHCERGKQGFDTRKKHILRHINHLNNIS